MHVDEYCDAVRTLADDVVQALYIRGDWAEILRLAAVAVTNDMANKLDSEAVQELMAMRQAALGEPCHG